MIEQQEQDQHSSIQTQIYLPPHVDANVRVCNM